MLKHMTLAESEGSDSIICVEETKKAAFSGLFYELLEIRFVFRD
jgi:hypothetical protein